MDEDKLENKILYRLIKVVYLLCLIAGFVVEVVEGIEVVEVVVVEEVVKIVMDIVGVDIEMMVVDVALMFQTYLYYNIINIIILDLIKKKK